MGERLGTAARSAEGCGAKHVRTRAACFMRAGRAAACAGAGGACRARHFQAGPDRRCLSKSSALRTRPIQCTARRLSLCIFRNACPATMPGSASGRSSRRVRAYDRRPICHACTRQWRPFHARADRRNICSSSCQSAARYSRRMPPICRCRRARCSSQPTDSRCSHSSFLAATSAHSPCTGLLTIWPSPVPRRPISPSMPSSRKAWNLRSSIA